MESRTCVSFYFGLVNWMYLHLRVDVHARTRIRYCSFQMLSRYPFSY
ncbi:unnamed protein product [Schistosoma margrebowiei]|uniref:Uncharacterized protein n=1 Tax=Schistosoma margrebowiei TaxID=48269 RepID=A0A183MGC1_9TREM|nr:unnamed protein product [Schistosoma margrebowiei]